MELDLSHYTPDHQRELEGLLEAQSWRAAIDSGLAETVKKDRVEPGETIDYIETVVGQLVGFNGDRVKALIGKGNEDRDDLLDEFSTWPADMKGKNPVLSFAGFNVTSQCNFDPRCTYCNQPDTPSLVHPDQWKDAIGDIADSNHPDGTYIYITGGEPLQLGEEIWGDRGIIRFAAEKGAAVNTNTNATLVTPDTALYMVKSGLAKLHISLDSADPEIQNYLFGGERLDQVLEGIYNIQLAREIVGVPYPVIHTNCVLTDRNLDSFPELFALILEKHKQTVDRDDPLYNDLFPHVIPVGGSNSELRPGADSFRRFYEKVWPQVTQMWDTYQADRGVAEEKRGVLFGYFSNPFLRVQHRDGMDAYLAAAEKGRYGERALARHCYVAPTQACFAPDGNQYRCGSHAIRRIHAIGNIKERGVFDNIRNGIGNLDDFPNPEDCYGCALATLYINQSVEGRLLDMIKGWGTGQ